MDVYICRGGAAGGPPESRCLEGKGTSARRTRKRTGMVARLRARISPARRIRIPKAAPLRKADTRRAICRARGISRPAHTRLRPAPPYFRGGVNRVALQRFGLESAQRFLGMGSPDMLKARARQPPHTLWYSQGPHLPWYSSWARNLRNQGVVRHSSGKGVSRTLPQSRVRYPQGCNWPVWLMKQKPCRPDSPWSWHPCRKCRA